MHTATMSMPYMHTVFKRAQTHAHRVQHTHLKHEPQLAHVLDVLQRPIVRRPLAALRSRTRAAAIESPHTAGSAALARDARSACSFASLAARVAAAAGTTSASVAVAVAAGPSTPDTATYATTEFERMAR